MACLVADFGRMYRERNEALDEVARAHHDAQLRQAAPMHDIGKIGVPDGVLKKPGSFTPEERAVMNQHPRIGAEILGRSRIPLFQLAAEVALSHHERWDGGSYPAGLASVAIPLSGRIVAVVDFFDAVTMDRCYRRAYSDEAALTMLQAERGRAFDLRVLDAFMAHVAELIALRDQINQHNAGLSEVGGAADSGFHQQP